MQQGKQPSGNPLPSPPPYPRQAIAGIWLSVQQPPGLANPKGITGSYAWTQTANWVLDIRGYENAEGSGAMEHWSCTDVGCDGLPDDPTGNKPFVDAPGFALNPANFEQKGGGGVTLKDFTSFTASMQFLATLEYKPDPNGSAWVPLGAVKWFVGGTCVGPASKPICTSSRSTASVVTGPVGLPHWSSAIQPPLFVNQSN